MVKVEEYEIIVVLSRIAEACGAMDTVIDFVDQRPAAVLKKYRMYLGNTINDFLGGGYGPLAFFGKGGNLNAHQ